LVTAVSSITKAHTHYCYLVHKIIFTDFQENSILYSLSHEVAQRAVISDKSLSSLQSYLDVLIKFFPGRKNTIRFLQEVRTFVSGHEDMLRGEDLQVRKQHEHFVPNRYKILDSNNCRLMMYLGILYRRYAVVGQYNQLKNIESSVYFKLFFQ
jgi:hypothetical protein